MDLNWPGVLKIQSNLVDWKSLGLEFLFPIVSILNNREVDIKIYNPQNDYYQCFFSMKDMYWSCKR